MTRRERWVLRAATPEHAEALRNLAQDLVQRSTPVSEVIHLAGGDAWVKGSRLHGSGARRHALNSLLLRRPMPRLSEYDNLDWLRKQGFNAPAPLAAGVLWRGWVPLYQLLATDYLDGAATLADVLAHPSDSHGALLETLAFDIARMHALGFIHHDLFLRNLLVVRDEAAERIAFLDAWAGGRRRTLRGPAYDLACLFSDLTTHAAPALQACVLQAYLKSRQLLGHPVSTERLVASVEREYRALQRKLGRVPDHWTARDLLREDVTP